MGDRQQVHSSLTAYGIRYVASTDTTGEERPGLPLGLQDEDLNGRGGGLDRRRGSKPRIVIYRLHQGVVLFNHDDHCIGHDIFAFYYSL